VAIYEGDTLLSQQIEYEPILDCPMEDWEEAEVDSMGVLVACILPRLTYHEVAHKQHLKQSVTTVIRKATG